MEDRQREQMMRRALRLAARGGGWTAPNPRVGAVIVQAGQIAGQGWHRRCGGPHAEVEAIADARRRGNDVRGATMFVTLEPCCHTGRTGPCTQALLAAGIARVEVAILDANPLVSGRGAQWLREQGVEVQVGLCEAEAWRMNAGFFRVQRQGRPGVVLKWAQSLDGKLAWPVGHSLAGSQGASQRRWISNERSRRHVHQVRSECGAILVGVGTVLADDPELTVRPGRGRYQPRRVVLDSQLRTPVECKLLQTREVSPVLVYTQSSTLERERAKAAALREAGAEVLAVGEQGGRIGLDAVLADLAGRGVNDVYVEGGPTVLASFWQAGLVDRAMVYVAPVILGAAAAELELAGPRELGTEVFIRRFGEDVLIEAWFGND